MTNEIGHDHDVTREGPGGDARSGLGMRALLMLLFALLWAMTELVLLVVTLLQLGWAVAAGSANERLTRFGGSLARYFAEVTRFLTFDSDRRPFPFADWPGREALGPGTSPGR